MAYETISFSTRDGIATLMLNRPQVMNALNTQMRAEITDALNTLPEDVRCVVMTGAGAAFCSGQDLSDAAAAADIEGTLRREYEPMLQAVINCRAPVICAVNGAAAGAGANLALAADVVIAIDQAEEVAVAVGRHTVAALEHKVIRAIGITTELWQYVGP